MTELRSPRTFWIPSIPVFAVFAVFTGLALTGCAAVDNGAPEAGPAPAPGGEPGRTPQALRVLTYNIHGGEPVTGGSLSMAALQRARAGQSMATFLAHRLASVGADVIALQEAKSSAFVQELATHLRMTAAYFPGGWREPKLWPEGIPTAILTPHRLVASTNCPIVNYASRPNDLFTRGYGKVWIEAYGEPITVFVAHLLPAWTGTTHIREREIREILAAAQAERQAGRSVLVLGDMNHPPAMPEYELWAPGGLTDTVGTKGAGDQFTAPSAAPTERIDYIFVAGALATRLESATVLHGANWSLDPTNPASFALSDHLPVVAVFGKRRQ